MATYQITSPDGQKFRVTAPDDATEEQVLSYARENMAPKGAQIPSVTDVPRAPEAVHDSLIGNVTDFGRSTVAGLGKGAGEVAGTETWYCGDADRCW